MRRVFPLMIMMAAAGAASAQDKNGERVPEASVRLGGSHSFDADFKDVPGGMSVSRGFARLDATFPVLERSTIGLGLGMEYSAYEFDDTAVMGPVTGAAWDDVLQTDLMLRFATKVNDSWSWFAGAGVQAAGEEGADFADSLAYGVTGGASYRFSETFTLGAGLIVRTRLEDGVLVVPLVTFDWKIAPRWRLATNAGPNEVGLGLSWEACEKLTLTLAGAYALREFRLDDASTSATPNFIGRDERLPVWIGVDWRAGGQVNVHARAGFNAYQQISMDNAGGDELADESLDASGFLEAGVTFTF